MNLYLPGIPPPFHNESLASWIQRICQIYDLTFTRFHRTFSTSNRMDVDLCATSPQLIQITQICGIKFEYVKTIQASFCRLAEQPKLQRLLLTRLRDGYDYRFCPRCWSDDKIPYFRLEWRFRHCEYCLIHKTKLETHCLACGHGLATHRAMLGGTSHPAPVPHLAICLYCRKDLRSAGAIIAAEQPALEALNNVKLAKAIVSAVVHGYFLIEPFQERRSLNEMLQLLDGVGLEPPDEKTTKILAGFERADLELLRGVIAAAVRGTRWLMPGHPRRKVFARTAFRFWLEKIYPEVDD